MKRKRLFPVLTLFAYPSMNVCVIDSRVCQRCRVLLYRRQTRLYNNACYQRAVPTLSLISHQLVASTISSSRHTFTLFSMRSYSIDYSTVLPHFTYLIRYAIQQLQCRLVHIRLSVYLVHFKLIYKLLRVINKFKTANPNRDPFIHSTNLSVHKNIFVCLILYRRHCSICVSICIFSACGNDVNST